MSEHTGKRVLLYTLGGRTGFPPGPPIGGMRDRGESLGLRLRGGGPGQERGSNLSTAAPRPGAQDRNKINI